VIDLGGKTAVVSGGGNIGREIAANFARAGAGVFVLDVVPGEVEAMKRAAAEASPGVRVEGAEVDLRDPASIESAVAAVMDACGRIDCLVNNAAVFEAIPVMKTTVEKWDWMFEVNARGTFLMMQAVAARMMKGGGEGGRIVNLSSSDGFLTESPYAAYSATKAAIISFTRTAAIELAPHNINVNAIAPGIVNAEVGQNADVRQAAVEARVPLGRIATPRNIADGAVFLCSEMASYVTGEVLVIDGGMTVDGTIREANDFLTDVP